MSKFKLKSPQYTELLRRWRQLRDKETFDGLTVQEAKEIAQVNEQLGAAELAFDQREQERQDAIAVSQTPFAMIADDSEL